MQSPGHHAQRLLSAATVLLTLATGTSGAPAGPWPALLGSREAFPPDVSAAVGRAWISLSLAAALVRDGVSSRPGQQNRIGRERDAVRKVGGVEHLLALVSCA